MKTILSWRQLALGLLSLLSLRGVGAETATPPATILSGRLTHAPAADSVRLVYGTHRAATVLTSAGDFIFRLADLTAPTQVTFSYGDQHTFLWLSPGDRQHLTLDYPKFDESLRYRGRGAEASNYLARSLYRFGFEVPGQVSNPNSHATPLTLPTAYRQAQDDYRHQRQAFLTTYAHAHPLPSGFQRAQQQNIDIQWATELLFFPVLRVQGDYDATKQPQLPADYFDFLQQLPLRQIAAHPTTATQENLSYLVNLYFIRLVGWRGHLSPDPAEAHRLYALATAELGPTPARDQAMYNLFKEKMVHDLPGVEAAYPTFRAQNRDSALARQLRQRLAARRQLAPGQLAPDFTLRDHTGREVSLRELRGKVVYLDFWGTWCPPCMKELTTASPALKKQFEGRDVVFVYVAMRDTEAKWQQVLADKQLTSANSVHLRAPDMAIPERYQVLYYPTYYLIGRDGRIVQAYAPRPSEGAQTVAAIEAVLSAPPLAEQAQR